ncbi:uncharacterized protein Z520_02085 [Fonsecaea multimorphosa CBS 102226]|uniref:Uncharacterized protein n=1 Tax=Fonsecaea multimorphosa CBS 102226 TaxID=1442371 RepID=A0A0D2IY49_9EURO|nr:uncharacterized protein Z520_02085 [Fonsecaea multimorphosa CBS 102226]KIY01947.1 hypothetical protein Z520_02085 [Fonsecaea multimorphosa CBS 102226]OAL29629.1 hypothetical protein AYO22_02043 [Fonsecaea multimorphosa]
MSFTTRDKVMPEMAFSKLTQKHLALLTAISVLTTSAPIPKGRLFPGVAIKSLQPTSCDHPGNADFYGLGIRLGIYLQIFSTMLFMIDPDSSDALYDAHDSNAILLLATFVAVLKSTPSRSIELVDVVIMLRMIWLIIVCGFSLAHLTEEYKRAKEAKKLAALITTPSALGFRILVAGLVSTYNAWFWFRGVGYFQQDNPCPTYAFFFAKLTANGRLQGFYKFTSVAIMLMPQTWLLACAVFYVASVALGLAIGIGLVVVVYAICLPGALGWILHSIIASVYDIFRDPHPVQKVLRFTRKMRRSVLNWRALKRLMEYSALRPISGYMPVMDKLAGKWTRIRQRGTMSEPGVRRAGTLPFRSQENRISAKWATYLVVLAVYYVFSIIGIELTIFWNSVEGSYDIGSTGQLIPFVIGILTTIKVLARVLSSTDGTAYNNFQRLRFFMISIFSTSHRIKRSWSFDMLQKPPDMLGRVRRDHWFSRASRKKLKRAASLPFLRRYDPSEDRPTTLQRRTEINKWLRNIPQGPLKEARVKLLIWQFQHGGHVNPARERSLTFGGALGALIDL